MTHNSAIPRFGPTIDGFSNDAPRTILSELKAASNEFTQNEIHIKSYRGSFKTRRRKVHLSLRKNSLPESLFAFRYICHSIALPPYSHKEPTSLLSTFAFSNMVNLSRTFFAERISFFLVYRVIAQRSRRFYSFLPFYDKTVNDTTMTAKAIISYI